MKKVWITIILSIICNVCQSYAHTTANDDNIQPADTGKIAREVMLDDIDVTGSRAPLTHSQAARMVTVMTRDDIAKAPVQSVNDLLKYAVGVDVRQRGTLGSQTDISIRGGTQEQVAILLNGINICDPQTGHNTLDLPCQLSEIVRIEVLEGPAGRAYGTSSLVGAINIVTISKAETGKDARVGVEMEGGSFGYARAGITARLSSPRHRNSDTTKRIIENRFSGGYSRSDGFSRSKAGNLNTDYSGAKAFYQGSYDDESVRVDWHLGLSDRGWGSGTFYATPRWQADDQYEHTTKIFSAIHAETKRGTLRLRPAIYWNHNRDRYEGYRGKPDILKYNNNKCDVYGVNINSYFEWMAGRTAFGAEMRNEDLRSGNLGEPKHDSGKYLLGINRTNTSAYLEHNILLRNLTLSAGLVAMKSNQSDMGWQVYPGVDFSYRLNGQINVFASYNSSLRLPSFTEMYYKLQGYAANPHLKPEEMRAVEIGTQYLSPILSAKVALWHHHGKNMIDWIMDTSAGDQSEWQSVNHTKINATGIETTLDLSPLMSRISPVTTLRLSYTYIDQDKEKEPDIVSQYALEYLRHKFVAEAQTEICKNLTLGIHLRWQDRVGQYTTFSGEVNDYRPFAIIDTRLTWNQKGYQVFAEANNLFDNRHYVDFGNVPQPGIWFIAGASVNINL